MGSDLVVGYGSTSIMHPLLHYKKVIDIGKNSAYFNFINPPVSRCKDFRDLSKIIKKI